MRTVTDERGTVAIIVALALTTLMGMAALAIDAGAAMSEHDALQTGADAAAIAVARDCADAMVDPTLASCTEAAALTTAATYFDENSTNTVMVERELDPPLGGRLGHIAVSGTVPKEPIFARMIEGVDGPIEVAAAAVARWGPVTAFDGFPLAVCAGALPLPGTGEKTLVVDPAATTPPLECLDAPTEDPFGWVPPDDLANCAASITLLPTPTTLDVGPADSPPSGVACDDSVDALFDAIASSTSSPEDRTRVLPVYDAAAGTLDARPSYSLMAFEFTGARIGPREAHQGSSEACPAGVSCIRGMTRYLHSSADVPIADVATGTLPGIDVVTVLDVRLVE